MTSKTAVTSMILGIVGAFLTGLVSSLFGTISLVLGIVGLCFAIAGMRATKDGEMEGRGFAIAGLVLSIVSICFGIWGVMTWTALIAAIYSL